jgi:hypothetical protein
MVSHHQLALLAQPMYGACDLISIYGWQRLDDVVHRAGTAREGSDGIEYSGSNRRHGPPV